MGIADAWSSEKIIRIENEVDIVLVVSVCLSKKGCMFEDTLLVLLKVLCRNIYGLLRI